MVIRVLAVGAMALLWIPALSAAGPPVRVIKEWGHDVSAALSGAAREQAAPVVRAKSGESSGTSAGMNLLGLGTGFAGPQGNFKLMRTPPDANASVGATQVVETVNLHLAVFDKSTGAVTLGPLYIGKLWTGFSPSCTQWNIISDPVVVYDKQAGRWLVVIHTLSDPYTICMAVSTTSDATGSYYRYAFQVQSSGAMGNEQVGVWPDAYYLAHWIYASDSTYVGPAACAADRDRMIAGQTATMQCFQINNPLLRQMAPADLDGSIAPPAGSPNYYLTQGPPGSNSLYMYRFHVDFTNPASSTLTGPVMIGVAPFANAPVGALIPQPGTKQLLQVNGIDILPRLGYRNFANALPAYESLVATHAVLVGTSRVGLRWYELRNPGTTPTVFQQGTYSPDANSRWMGSIAMDAMGDIAIGYSVSSSSVYPGIRYAGRVPSDPLNELQPEATIMDGSASQTRSSRWGDYTSMSVDPTDDCTMWYTGQYIPLTGTWATRLFSFRFPECATQPAIGLAKPPAPPSYR